MTHPPRHLALATLLAALVVSPAIAQEPADDSWVGKRVITTDGTVLMDGDKAIANTVRDRGWLRTYRVEKAEGPRLWLAAEKIRVEGWAPVANVLTLEQAIDYLSNQIKVDPAVSKYYVDRGAIRLEMGDFDAAISDLNVSIRLDPKGETAYSVRGTAWYSRHDHEKAIADYGEAIRLDPNNALAYFNRGLVWGSRQDHEKAIIDFNEAIRLNPMIARSYRNRAAAWFAKKEYGKAFADFDRAIQLDPTDALNYLNRGLAHNARTEYAKALADFNQAIVANPSDANAYYVRAMIWATCPDNTLRDGKRAVESATRACELSDWKVPRMLFTLSAAYAEVGDYVKAREWQDKANRLANFQKEMDDLTRGLKSPVSRLPHIEK